MSRSSFLRQQAERLKHALQQAKEQTTPTEQRPQSTKPGNQQNNLATYEGLVERRIQDGMARGLFDNLAGMGRPLNLYDDAFVPEEMRMAFRILRSNGLAPLWIEINKEIQEDVTRFHRIRDYAAHHWPRLNIAERGELRQQYAARVDEINTKIMQHNLLAPSSYVHRGLLLVADEVREFDKVTRDASTG
ncbi:MAG: hypothetical protein NVSMB42_27180 [Herpetosiphon sp.]